MQAFHGAVGLHHMAFDAKYVQNVHGNLALFDVLWLVMHAGPAPPAHQKHHRDGIHLWVDEGCNGIDRIAKAGVLHVNQRGFAGGEVVPRRDAHGVALVGGDDVLLSGAIERSNVIAELLQLRVRHAGEKIDVMFL